LQALIGETETTRTALSAEVHQEYNSRRANFRLCVGTNRDNRSGSFMTRRGAGAVKKLRPFRTAQSVSVHPKEKLSFTRFRNRFFSELNSLIPNESWNAETGGYGFKHKVWRIFRDTNICFNELYQRRF